MILLFAFDPLFLIFWTQLTCACYFNSFSQMNFSGSCLMHLRALEPLEFFLLDMITYYLKIP